MSGNSTLVGIVILTRHGDREGFYQDPTTYTASATELTPLGEQQEFQNGVYIRNRYLLANGTNPITGIQPDVADNHQINALVDGAGEGSTIVDSAYAFFQGLYPPTLAGSQTITLANGTVVSAIDSLQFVQVNTLNPSNSFNAFESFTGCNAFTAHTNNVYNSSLFVEKTQEANGFLSSLAPIVGNRSLTLANVYNIYDFFHVQSIHNATFPGTPAELAQLQDLASFHEDAVFTDPDPNGIGNIAGQTLLPFILDSLNSLTNTTAKAPMISYFGLAYKPFISLFNMTNLGDQLPNYFVDYASMATFELHRSGMDDYTVRFNFKNGSLTQDLTPYYILNQTTLDVPLATFNDALGPLCLASQGEWCNKCSNTQTFGCDLIAKVNATQAQATLSSSSAVTPAQAGGIGASVTLFVVALLAALVWLLSKRRRDGGRRESLHSFDDVKEATA